MRRGRALARCCSWIPRPWSPRTTPGSNEGFHQRIIDEIARLQDYDLVLYLSPDVPWVDDGTRVFGEEREEADEGLRALLAEHGVEVVEVRGDFARRLDIAVTAVDRLLDAESAGSSGTAAR